MFIQHHVEVLAFSDNGDAVLIERRGDGPEGGGSLGWSVIGPADMQYFEVSSDYSPGDGSTPESISGGDCRDRAKALAARLKAAGFSGVTANPDKCASKRHEILTVPEAARPKSGAGKDLDVAIGDSLVTYVAGGTTLAVTLDEHLFATVYRRGDDGPLVVLLLQTDHGSSLPVFVSLASGAPVQVKFPDTAPLPR